MCSIVALCPKFSHFPSRRFRPSSAAGWEYPFTSPYPQSAVRVNLWKKLTSLTSLVPQHVIFTLHHLTIRHFSKASMRAVKSRFTGSFQFSRVQSPLKILSSCYFSWQLSFKYIVNKSINLNKCRCFMVSTINWNINTIHHKIAIRWNVLIQFHLISLISIHVL